MKPIKIMGEAKSATTYLEKLIRLNTNAQVCSSSVNHKLGWKHGFPIPGNALYLFLMRDPVEWVKSYLANPSDSRFSTLKGAFGNREGFPEQQHWGRWDNLMQARNYKYKAYIDFCKHHGGVIIKTEYLKDNPQCILFLNEYGFMVRDPIVDITSHVYKKDVEGKDDPRRKPLRADQLNWVRKNDNMRFVDDLTIKIY